MKLATQDKPFFPEAVKDKMIAMKEMGFDGFEIDGKLLVEHLDEVKQAIRETGLEVPTACGGYAGWIGDFDEKRRANGISEISEILRALSEVGGTGIVIPAAWGMFSKRLPPMNPPRSDEEDEQILLDSLSKLEKVAEATGTVIYLEPLNRYEDHMINTVSRAQELIVTGGFKHVEVIADFFHMNIEEADIGGSLQAVSEHLGHIHLADSHRFQPGSGHLDFKPGMKMLKDLNYQGYFSIECRVLGDDPVQAYRESVQFVRNL